MNMIQEIEGARKRILQEVNTEFDILLDHISQFGNVSSQKEQTLPYEVKYPLTAGASLFKGHKPTSVIINDIRYDVRTWKHVVKEILTQCIATEKYKEALFDNAGKISGRKRYLLACSDEDMRSPLNICDNLYMETHYDTETLLNVLMNRILSPIGYDYSNIYVTIRNA